MMSLKKEICCLKGIGTRTTAHKLIPLVKEEEISIGRSDSANVKLTDVIISRKHCILKKIANDKWTIMDNKSFNGVLVNSEKLKSLAPYTLCEGDRIQLGGDKMDEAHPYVWTFRANMRVKCIKPTGDTDSSSLSLDSAETSASQRKRKREDSGNLATTSKSEGCTPSKRAHFENVWSPSLDMKKKLEEQELQMNEKLAEQEAKLIEMQALLLQKEAAQEQLQRQLKEKEDRMKKDMLKKQEELKDQRQKFEEKMKISVEEQIREKEEALQCKLEAERVRLISEKRKVEESLKRELQTKLGEKDKVLQVKLEKEQHRLEKVIQKKECEQKLLSAELEKTKAEKEKHKEDAWKTKEAILSNLNTLMETELQCSICNEMFIEATSLGCKHSYCAYCIEQWSSVKKECPVCRTKITTQIRSIALDNYIDKMTEQLSDEMKQRRKQLIDERNEERREKERQVQETRDARRQGRGGRRRGRGRGRRVGARPATNRTQTRAAANADVREHVIEIESEGEGADNDNPVIIDSDLGANEEVVVNVSDIFASSSDDSEPAVRGADDYDSDESIDGVGGAYFGGYGYCYNCGHRGHWANGCPFD